MVPSARTRPTPFIRRPSLLKPLQGKADLYSRYRSAEMLVGNCGAPHYRDSKSIAMCLVDAISSAETGVAANVRVFLDRFAIDHSADLNSRCAPNLSVAPQSGGGALRRWRRVGAKHDLVSSFALFVSPPSFRSASLVSEKVGRRQRIPHAQERPHTMPIATVHATEPSDLELAALIEKGDSNP